MICSLHIQENVSRAGIVPLLSSVWATLPRCSICLPSVWEMSIPKSLSQDLLPRNITKHYWNEAIARIVSFIHRDIHDFQNYLFSWMLRFGTQWFLKVHDWQYILTKLYKRLIIHNNNNNFTFILLCREILDLIQENICWCILLTFERDETTKQ